MALLDLFRPKWKHSNPIIRRKAIYELTDISLLSKIVLTDTDEGVRERAVQKLTDEKLLSEVATKDEHPVVRQAAVERLTDETVLAEVAINDNFLSVQKKAVQKLKDEKLLTEVIIKSIDKNIQKEAVQKVKDEKALARLAVICNEREICLFIIERIRNMKIISELAINNTNSEAGKIVIEINDWVMALRINSIEAFQKYIDRHETGMYLSQAKKKIKKLNDELMYSIFQEEIQNQKKKINKLNEIDKPYAYFILGIQIIDTIFEYKDENAELSLIILEAFDCWASSVRIQIQRNFFSENGSFLILAYFSEELNRQNHDSRSDFLSKFTAYCLNKSDAIATAQGVVNSQKKGYLRLNDKMENKIKSCVSIGFKYIMSRELQKIEQILIDQRNKPKKYKSEKLYTVSEEEKEENRLKKSKEIEKRMKEIELLTENEVPFWENVRKVNSEEAIRSYITEYPNGKFLDEAIEILNRLRGL